MQVSHRSIGADFEYYAQVIRATVGSRAIKNAVAALHQSGLGFCAIIAAGEVIQIGQHPISADLKHGAIAYPESISIRPATFSCTIQITIAALHQPGMWICAIMSASEGIQTG